MPPAVGNERDDLVALLVELGKLLMVCPAANSIVPVVIAAPGRNTTSGAIRLRIGFSPS